MQLIPQKPDGHWLTKFRHWASDLLQAMPHRIDALSPREGVQSEHVPLKHVPRPLQGSLVGPLRGQERVQLADPVYPAWQVLQAAPVQNPAVALAKHSHTPSLQRHTPWPLQGFLVPPGHERVQVVP